MPYRATMGEMKAKAKANADHRVNSRLSRWSEWVAATRASDVDMEPPRVRHRMGATVRRHKHRPVKSVRSDNHVAAAVSACTIRPGRQALGVHGPRVGGPSTLPG